MRLKSIKLAGFKSFVDPTTLNLPTNLTCVVGPNGCGKSNTIDAVRWVMGESSAKHLRGESSTDVIFNGSSTRKPVSKASIELIFDNSSGKLGGQYGAFTEISVRREVNREAQSNYFLNGSRCRKRDITDIFLGTGLGPRSYAIIEQGMIARFIEAKPDELRVFIEEAAGISKYKERRRETEIRMRHTNENLDRLNDLRDEVDTQLKKLKRQAEVAERYKEFQGQKRQVEMELAALRWQELEDQGSSVDTAAAQLADGLRDSEAGQNAMVSKLDQGRVEQQAAQDSFNDVQGRYYAIGADVARLEQSLKHGRELRERQKAELSSMRDQQSSLQSQITADETSLLETRELLKQLAEQSAEARETANLSQQSLDEAEDAEREMQQRWDDTSARASVAQRETDIEQTRLENLEDRQRRGRERAQKIDEDLKRQEISPLLQQLAEQGSAFELAEQQAEAAVELAEEKRGAVTELRERERNLQAELHQQRGEMQQLGGRITSLETLKQAALRDSGKAVTQWLQNQGMQNLPTVGERLQVTNGWELAVEAVLGHWLQGRVGAGVGDAAGWPEFPDGQVALFDAEVAQISASDNSLASQVSGLDGLQPWLAKVRCADSLAEALTNRSQLAADERFVTKQGVQLGPNWICSAPGGSKAGSALERERELRELTQRREELEQLLESSEAKSAQLREQLNGSQLEARSAEQAQQEAQRGLQELRGQLDRLRSRHEQMEQRKAQLEEELQAITEQSEEDQATEKSTRGKLEAALEILTVANEERAGLEQQRMQSRDAVQQSRIKVREQRSAAEQLNAKLEAQRATERSLATSMERQKAQLSTFDERQVMLMEAVENADEPIALQQEELAVIVEQRLGIDSELAEARNRLAGFDNTLREYEQQRAQHELKGREIREKLEQARLGLRETRVRQQGYLDKLRERELEPEQVLEKLSAKLEEAELPPAQINEWQQRLEQLEQRIARLGTVNLAAIEEYETTAERQNYLNSQHADLTEALEILTSAISKIDRETRARFSETFNLINDHLKQMFPRLFGGGAAWLEMTGDDVLDTGVTIMARPPGKRNSTIHLLSGGEKALTAVAMVFSIFQLNPAPFCMLDEVDAPLDDANVGRFSKLVEEMSAQLQFVYISHNKVAMEMANSLLGVTMQEPGVSRLVSVDVEEAVQMVAA